MQKYSAISFYSFKKSFTKKTKFIQRRLGKSISCNYFCDYFLKTVERDRIDKIL